MGKVSLNRDALPFYVNFRTYFYGWGIIIGLFFIIRRKFARNPT